MYCLSTHINRLKETINQFTSYKVWLGGGGVCIILALLYKYHIPYKFHMSVFLGCLLTIITCTRLVLPISFFFSLISTINLSLDLNFAISLAMAKLKRGINVVILFLIVFVFPEMFSFGNITPLLSSLTFVLPYLPPLFRNLSRRVKSSFYRCSRSPFGLLYPTIRYFLCFFWIALKWTGGRWTGWWRATQLWA